jgi:hypothetical protein
VSVEEVFMAPKLKKFNTEPSISSTSSHAPPLEKVRRGSMSAIQTEMQELSKRGIMLAFDFGERT